MSEVLVAAAIMLAVDALFAIIGNLIDRIGQSKMPETAQAPLSDTDKKKVQETRQVIKECFGENVVDRIRSASNRERISLMGDFAEKLVQAYNLDIEVDVTVSELKNCGAYDWKEKKAVFNIAMLMLDGGDEHFDYCVRETLDTIIHELRHAVQYRAVQDQGFWNVDEKRRQEWAVNMAPGNYIRPEIDLRAYANQAIEKDAATFAAQAMEGVN